MHKFFSEGSLLGSKGTRSVSAETRARLISVAEQLIGARGLSGVSATDILEAAGQKNRSAIQYHFKSLDGLIDAALFERMRQIDGQRWPRLVTARAIQDREARIEALLDIALEPMLDEAASGEEGRSRVRFMSQAVVRPTLDLEAFSTFISQLAVYQIVSDLMQMRTTPASPDEMVMRARLTSILLLTTASEWATFWNDRVRREEARQVLQSTGRVLLLG